MTEVMEKEDLVFTMELKRYLESTNNPTAENAAAFRRLWESMSDAQRAEYVEGHKFTLVAKSGTKYEILCRGSGVGNVHVFDDKGQGVAGFCCYPRNQKYMANVYLGQKLALETDESYWLRTAIRSVHWVVR